MMLDLSEIVLDISTYYISKRRGKYNGLLQNMDAAFNPGGRNAFVLDMIQIVLLNIRKSDISGIHTLSCY